MGKVFIPVAWLMGVPWTECDLVGNLVALKTIVNEFAAYSKLSEYIAAGLISVRQSFQLVLRIKKYTQFKIQIETIRNHRNLRFVRIFQSWFHRDTDCCLVHNGT